MAGNCYKNCYDISKLMNEELTETINIYKNSTNLWQNSFNRCKTILVEKFPELEAEFENLGKN
jgi:hypothetical protein